MNSASKKITANFFWYGNELSIYENACLRSFLKNDFNVVVYSFQKIKLPKKIKFKDANKILKKSEIKKFIHGGKKVVWRPILISLEFCFKRKILVGGSI